jgi:hypothetical protein
VKHESQERLLILSPKYATHLHLEEGHDVNEAEGTPCTGDRANENSAATGNVMILIKRVGALLFQGEINLILSSTCICSKFVQSRRL